MFKYNKEQLLQLKSHVDSLRELESPNTELLTNELLQQLINRVTDEVKCFPNLTLDEAIFREYHSYACGCLGPRYGELYCNCRMSKLRYEYRYDIALSMLDG